MELSKTAYVILGMLRLGKRTGYEIKSLVDVSTRFFWAASYGQIYPELAKLEEAGLIRGEADGSNGRRRKAYELTDGGEKALQAWLSSSDPPHFELRHEGVLKFFFSDALPEDQRTLPLEAMREEHERVLEQLEAIAAGGVAEDEAGAPRLTLEWGIAYQRFAIDWCTEMEHRRAAKPAGKRGA